MQEKLAEMEREQRELEKQVAGELRRLKDLQRNADAMEGRAAGAPGRSMTIKDLTGAQSKLKNKQEIKALADKGQQEYDELTKKYLRERERQQEALEDAAAERRQRKQDADGIRERDRAEQEEKELQRRRALMEKQRLAQEKCNELTVAIHSRKRVTFKGGFSKTPLEQFNKVQNERKIQTELLGNETQQRA